MKAIMAKKTVLENKKRVMERFETSKKDIYNGTDWRIINKNEHRIVVQIELDVIDSLTEHEIMYPDGDKIVGICIDRLVSKYPAEKAEKGFYQNITFEGSTCRVIHPLVIDLFAQLSNIIVFSSLLKPREQMNEINGLANSLKTFLNWL